MSTSDHTTNPPVKRCPRCSNEYPATREYFSSHGKRGFFECKSCHAEAQRKWTANHPEKVREINKKQYAANRETKAAYNRRYYADHHDEICAQTREYRRKHAEQVRKGMRRWREANPDKVLAGSRRQYAAHPEKAQGTRQKRLARKAGLPCSFTNADWLRALNYFNGVCAYCGNPPRLWDNPQLLHRDHVIPLSDPRHDNPGYVVTNIVPACCKCNQSKKNHEVREWLIERFGTYKAKKILARIEAYFASLASV